VKGDNQTAFFIAFRYLFSKKTHNIINIISAISVLGVMASAAALIIVLSVFNGLQDFVLSNFNRFNPPLKIEAKEGKVFTSDKLPVTCDELLKIKGVKAVEQVLSDMVLITYNEKQALATLYGVSENYPKISGLDEVSIDGGFNTGSETGIIFGAGIAGLLGIELHNYLPVKLYYPKRNKSNLANPLDAFHTCYTPPLGIFASITQYDEGSVFSSISLAKNLFDYDSEISFIAIYIDGSVPLKTIQKEITQIVGDEFTVSNQMQQEAALYKTIQAENLIVFLILGFIFIIATFNIIGILGMLIVEKKEDISILHTLGASKTLLKKVFLMVGTMIGIFGGFLGLTLGLVCCLIQQHFGIITLGNAESFLVLNAYPVAISTIDFIITFFMIVTVSLLTSWFSLKGLNKSYIKNIY